jgi:hypothetical protein
LSTALAVVGPARPCSRPIGRHKHRPVSRPGQRAVRRRFGWRSQRDAVVRPSGTRSLQNPGGA